MRKILQGLLDHLQEDYPVKSISTYVHWILVESHHHGMASTVLGNLPHGEDLVSQAGHLLEKSARQLAAMSCSSNTLEAGIGLAAINSLIDPPQDNLKEGNVIQILMERSRGKKVTIIGHFPFIPKLKEIAKAVWVIDLNPAEDDFRPDKAPDLLPQSDIVAMTANTLITDATEDYLKLCKFSALKIMMGPSTPMTPLLFDYGFDILAGTRIVNPDLLRQFLSQGAAFSQIEGAEKITLIKE